MAKESPVSFSPKLANILFTRELARRRPHGMLPEEQRDEVDAELERVREKWCKKKFGFTDDGKADEIIAAVCETMKEDRNKSRVTFYYLVAKHMGTLGQL